MKSKRQKTYLLSALIIALTLDIVSAQPVDAFLGFNGNNFDTLPAFLSQTGFDPGNETVFVPYEVNVRQWRDLMKVERYVYVPAGKAITPGDTMDYTFPVGTVFFRVHYLELTYNDPATRKKIECQIQMRNTDSTWTRFTYLYRDDQTDAELVDATSFITKTFDLVFPPGSLPYEDTLQGVEAPGMTMTMLRTAYDCGACHYHTSANGFITQQLNRGNQLQELQAKGILNSVPDLTAMQARGLILKWHSWDDSGATLDQKARSYLAGNCSQCHNHIPERADLGRSSSFQYFRDEPNPDFIGTGNDSAEAAIVRGNPITSQACIRICDKTMPPSTSFGPLDAKGCRLLWNWTNALDGDPGNDALFPYPRFHVLDIRIPGELPQAPLHGYLRDEILFLGPTENTVKQVQVFSVQGRELKLRKISQSRYKLPDNVSPGNYIVKVDGRTVTVRSFD